MYVTEESIQQARSADLYAYLVQHHLNLFRQTGRDLRLKTKNSLVIHSGFAVYHDFCDKWIWKWYRFSYELSALFFMQEGRYVQPPAGYLYQNRWARLLWKGVRGALYFLHGSNPADQSAGKPLRVPAFIRTNHGVRLTPAGKSLYEDAKTLIRFSEDALEKARLLAESSESTLRIGTSLVSV